MSKRYTTESFKLLVKEMYGDAVGTDNLVYVDSSTHVVLHCEEHGDYCKRPNKVQQGKGRCPVCVQKRLVRQSREYYTSYFTERLGELQPWMTVLSISFIDTKCRVRVCCELHQVCYETNSNVLLRGSGCPKCKIEKFTKSNTKSTEDFLRSAKERRGDAFDYRHVEYKHHKHPVKLICNSCATLFEQKPVDHLRGTQCPYCSSSGFKENLPGSLYVLNAGDVTKVGITNREVHTRIEEINKSSNMMFELVKEYRFSCGAVAKSLEKLSLSWLRKRYESPNKKFDGSTECFCVTDATELICFINSTIKENNYVF